MPATRRITTFFSDAVGDPHFGIGGGIPITPFGAWSYDFTEEQAQELLQNCPARCVLVSHSPPKGAVDQAGGQSLGSVSVRDAVERRRGVSRAQ